MRTQALNILLWYSVFAWATWLGGTLYRILVVVTMWSSAPPESVRSFFLGTDDNRHIFHFFGPPFMAARVLPVVLALALASHLAEHRVVLGASVACLVAAVLVLHSRTSSRSMRVSSSRPEAIVRRPRLAPWSNPGSEPIASGSAWALLPSGLR